MNSCSAQSAAGTNEFGIVSERAYSLANAGFLQGTYCYRLSDFNGIILPPPPRFDRQSRRSLQERDADD
jgi:hypothetical protein